MNEIITTTNIKQEYELYIFDLDNTIILHHQHPENRKIYEKKLFETMKILKNNGKKLALATHNSDPILYLKFTPIPVDFFDHIEYREKFFIIEEKEFMVYKILTKYKILPKDAIFFDDQKEHVNAVSSLGVKSHLVDKDKGIDISCLI